MIKKLKWLYIIGMPIITYWYVYRACNICKEANTCLADCIVWNGNYPKKSVALLSGLMIIGYLMNYYRIGVVLRYKSRLTLLMKQYIRVIVIAVITSVYQMLLVCTMGFIYVPYTCNWESSESLPFILRGLLVEEHLQTFEYGLHVMYMTGTTVLISGMVIVLFWWLLENPLLGYVLNYVLVLFEIGIYGVVDVHADKVYMSGIDMRMYTEPLKVIPIIVIVTLLIMKRKDYLRIK